MDALDSDEHLHPFIFSGIPSKDNGFDIDGLANAIAQQPSILVVYDSPAPITQLSGAAAVTADIFPLG